MSTRWDLLKVGGCDLSAHAGRLVHLGYLTQVPFGLKKTFEHQ